MIIHFDYKFSREGYAMRVISPHLNKYVVCSLYSCVSFTLSQTNFIE